MYIAWGPRLIMLYNAAYISLLDGRHPSTLGAPLLEVWPELWPSMKPLVERALGGHSTYGEDVPRTIRRAGQPYGGWFTLAYSPVRDGEGAVRGFLCVISETTPRVQLERRHAVQLQVVDSLRRLHHPSDIIESACALLGKHLELDHACYVEGDGTGSGFEVVHDWAREGGAGAGRTARPHQGLRPGRAGPAAHRRAAGDPRHHQRPAPARARAALRGRRRTRDPGAAEAAPRRAAGGPGRLLGRPARLGRGTMQAGRRHRRAQLGSAGPDVGRAGPAQRRGAPDHAAGHERIPARTVGPAAPPRRPGPDLRPDQRHAGPLPAGQPGAVRRIRRRPPAGHLPLELHRRHRPRTERHLPGRPVRRRELQRAVQGTWVASDVQRDPRTGGPDTWPTFASLQIRSAVVVPVHRNGA
jgi:hypothetical protein